MTLDMGFLDLRGGSETGAQRMAREGESPLTRRKIAANAGRARGFFAPVARHVCHSAARR